MLLVHQSFCLCTSVVCLYTMQFMPVFSRVLYVHCLIKTLRKVFEDMFIIMRRRMKSRKSLAVEPRAPVWSPHAVVFHWSTTTTTALHNSLYKYVYFRNRKRKYSRRVCVTLFLQMKYTPSCATTLNLCSKDVHTSFIEHGGGCGAATSSPNH